MKRSFLTLLFSISVLFVAAQLDAIKPTEKKTAPKTNKPKTPKPVKPVSPKSANTESYIIVFRGEQLAAALSNYNIYVDGRKICALSNGKYFKLPVTPGKHDIEAKKAGVDLAKKESFATVIASPGKNNYISFNIKKTLLREKFEFNEMNAGIGKQLVDNLKEDNCQGDIGHK